MPRGRRLVTPEQEQQILAKIALRRRLSNKALAAQHNMSERSFKRVLKRILWQFDLASKGTSEG